MGTARRQYTDEFKREAVGLLAGSGRPLTQIAQELGIAVSRLRVRSRVWISFFIDRQHDHVRRRIDIKVRRHPRLDEPLVL